MYPSILIPYSLQSALNAELPKLIPPIWVEEPIKPEKPYRNLAGVFFSVIGLALLAFNTPIAVFILMVSIPLSLIIKFGYIRDCKEFIVIANNYELLLNQYINYPAAVTDYEHKLSEYSNPNNTELYRNEQVEASLKLTTKPEAMDAWNFPTQTPKKGMSEIGFSSFLTKWFSNVLSTSDVRLPLRFAANKYYYPDFCLCDWNKNLFIDVEIDEPYAADDKTPIHYLEQQNNRYVSVDSFRNTYFLECNWIVVRFSESQIVRNPDGCCRIIAEVICKVFPDAMRHKFDRLIAETSPVQNDKFWTFNEAKEMARLNTRNTT